jgi:hypothetical protein
MPSSPRSNTGGPLHSVQLIAKTSSSTRPIFFESCDPTHSIVLPSEGILSMAAHTIGRERRTRSGLEWLRILYCSSGGGARLQQDFHECAKAQLIG